MLDTSFDLWRTTCIVRTIPSRLTFISHQGRATLRTTLNELHRLCDNRTLVDIHTHDLRDNLAAFLHIHIIADMQVETLDEVLIIQRSALHCRTCQLHRIHVCHRRHSTSTSHLIRHLIQTGTDALCLELIGNGPTWTLGCKSK